MGVGGGIGVGKGSGGPKVRGIGVAWGESANTSTTSSSGMPGPSAISTVTARAQRPALWRFFLRSEVIVTQSMTKGKADYSRLACFKPLYGDVTLDRQQSAKALAAAGHCQCWGGSLRATGPLLPFSS